MRIALIACVALAAPACSTRPPRASAAPSPSCLAERTGTLELADAMRDCADDGADCEAACREGDAEACYARGVQLQLQPPSGRESEVKELYERACTLGSAIGCTNFAAGIWMNDLGERDAACALAIFERTCEAGEHFGCGMVGRVRAERLASERDAIATFLSSRCNEIGGFACRVLAAHIEKGDLPTAQGGSVAELLERACRGGDSDACGAPATAAETFR